MNGPFRKETRFYGLGLPEEGVADPVEAYRLALNYARVVAVCEWREDAGIDYSVGPKDIAENWDHLVRKVSKATDAFIANHGTALEMFYPDKGEGS